jgi:hypothetical protein
MKTQENIVKRVNQIIPKAENVKGIENHKLAAAHFQAAANNHLDAAIHHEKGNHEKAAVSTMQAYGHASLGRTVQKEDVKKHALLT